MTKQRARNKSTIRFYGNGQAARRVDGTRPREACPCFQGLPLEGLVFAALDFE
ncbi:hypothetical protein H6F78_25990 [Coleofasciculus sp. FACHB-64]|uniref:hypothetical protein n=1 Tax=Cyanophyceae TaxID=3028117 RepID=UPI0016844FE0|nr:MULTISPECIES: hypothetical protein [unclassified Coleofasciculus]MBD1841582.1 hypothetical protein [Coleofasciculus sp. FACHB-501]MBD2049009.1 hypothetical protein [Coleofasciculus sp. FACHB-64]